VSSVLRPHQHSIGYTGDGFYRSKDPTNSIKVLKEDLQKRWKISIGLFELGQNQNNWNV